MKPARRPKSAGCLGNQIIHAKRGNAGSSARRQPHDLRAVLTPREVLAPTITSRIEEFDEAFRDRITRLPLLTLELVAQRTTPTEIRNLSHAARRTGNDVVEMKGRQRHVLRSPAILAPFLRGASNLRAEFS